MLPLYLVYLIIVTLVVTGVSFSKYGTIVDGTDTARVAKPVLEYVTGIATYNGVQQESLSFENVKPGDAVAYQFQICNFKNEDLIEIRNEVLLRYKIEVSVEPENVLPLTKNLVGSYPSDGDGWTILGMGENITHSYTLNIVWNESQTGSEYANKTQTIRITINAEQID